MSSFFRFPQQSRLPNPWIYSVQTLSWVDWKRLSLLSSDLISSTYPSTSRRVTCCTTQHSRLRTYEGTMHALEETDRRGPTTGRALGRWEADVQPVYSINDGFGLTMEKRRQRKRQSNGWATYGALNSLCTHGHIVCVRIWEQYAKHGKLQAALNQWMIKAYQIPWTERRNYCS